MFCGGRTISNLFQVVLKIVLFFLTVRHHDGQETEKILVLFLKFGIQVFQELILELLSNRV